MKGYRGHNKRNERILWFIFASNVIKVWILWFRYYPVIDDWIQYGGYRL